MVAEYETKAKGEVIPKRGANTRQLQSHQSDAISAMNNLDKKFPSYSTLIVLPTGGGVFSKICVRGGYSAYFIFQLPYNFWSDVARKNLQH